MIEISGIYASLAQGRGEQSCLAVGLTEAVNLLKCLPHQIERIELTNRSVDARRRDRVHFVLGIRLWLADGLDEQAFVERVPERDRRRVRVSLETEPHFPIPLDLAPQHRPVVVGAGCAGLFCALALAHAGLAPLLIERGNSCERRTEAIDRFVRTGVLDPESNIQFGLGGAGTFSDGKLSTGTKNPAHALILKTFVEAGAARNILWEGKPHIGSDVLPLVVEHIVDEIRALGGEVRFRTRLIDIERDPTGTVCGITVETPGNESPSNETHNTPVREQIPCDRLVLACGHSARDVFELLDRLGVTMSRKTFAMGVRIEHAQEAIDRAQYGSAAGHFALGAAPYKLVAHPRDARATFTFCMCPGGEVVAAASEEGGVVTNGASKQARDGKNANAALLVNVSPADLPGDSVLAGIELQRRCERAAFAAGGGDYRAPAQLLGDFLAGVPSTGGGSVDPTYPRGVRWGALDALLPAYIIDGLRAGIPLLDQRLHGFADPEAVLTGVETRSSSPVTVVRDRSTFASVSAPGLYPCGEGAGYAGGIMSAATDGIRCAEAVVSSLV